MPSLPRLAIALCLGAGIGVAAVSTAGAASGRLYPSGPPNGVAYLRFANLSAHPAKITSAAGELALPADDPHRVGEFDPVTPGTELTGSVALDGKTAPIALKLAPNEFMTVVVTPAGAGGPAITPMHDIPTDFDAQKASLALYNLDRNCTAAQLVAGPTHIAVISDVMPDGLGRRLVNPVNVALAVACGGAAQPVAVRLGQLVAGERYSVFVFAAGSGPETLAVQDKTAPFHP